MKQTSSFHWGLTRRVGPRDDFSFPVPIPQGLPIRYRPEHRGAATKGSDRGVASLIYLSLNALANESIIGRARYSRKVRSPVLMKVSTGVPG